MPEKMSPAERSVRARMEGTAKARSAFLARFEDEVDPDRELTEFERKRRAESARKAYFTRLAYKSAQARRRRAAAPPGDQRAQG